ncbi:hypothetical protein ACFFRR_004063 [Megaselia abdita]
MSELPVIPDYAPPEEPLSPSKKKKPKLTAAEKKILKIQKQLELRKKLFKDHLEREIVYTNKSVDRGYKGWQDLLAGIKCEELKKDLEVLWQKTNQLVDQKNFKIEMLIHHLETSEDQYERNFAKHCDILEYLSNCFQLMIEHEKSTYEAKCKDLLSKFHIELLEKDVYFDGIKIVNENVMHSSNLLLENELLRADDAFKDQWFDTLTQARVDRSYLEEGNKKLMVQLNTQFNELVDLIKFQSLDAKKYEHYVMLEDKSILMAKEAKRLTYIENIILTRLASRQADLVAIELASNRQIISLKAERNYFIETYWRLKKSLAQANEHMMEQTRLLASESYEAVKHLKTLSKYGDLLVRLTGTCRKYETEREKVLPWETDDLTEDPKITFDPNNLVYYSEESLAEQLSSMKNFWQRVARVTTHKILLSEEKSRLQAENEKYQEILRTKLCSPSMPKLQIIDPILIRQLLDERKIWTKVLLNTLNKRF